ncbi:hypothetical protein MFIFM68171_10337 [Madurella fahalii]|uniref:Uncharacterized protein n=1 Tax=Madurella fahalii TaxID=1157608 RepID=A0ABQ0GQX9_9PEZI
MDHFNATVKDGKLVNTRRGLQVSKQKHNGLSFVNAYPQDAPPRPSSPAHRSPKPSQRQPGVTETDGETARGASIVQREDAGHLEFSFVPHTVQGPRRRRRGTQKEQPLASSRGNLSPRLASTSAEDGTTQPSLVGENANTLQRGPSPAGSVTSLSASVTGEADTQLSEANWKLFDRHFAHLPRNMYPYEDILSFNPVREGDFYAVVTGDIAALHCVLMCGTITEAVINSEKDPNDFAYHISKICSLLNQRLSHNYAADVVTLHCIATLAWMGCYVGRLDHWHMHMKGLQKVLDVNGGLAGLPPWLLTGMYKADLKGATALASSPYLPFTRRYYSSVSTVLPPDARSQAFNSIYALLDPLHIDPQVIDALSSLSLFASAVRLARHFAGSITFDPHAFTDEWLAITHALLTRPGPLRETPAGLENDPYSKTAGCSATSADEDSGSHTQNHIAAHRLRPSASVTPSPSGPPGVEPALRIAALLFLKELLPDWPRNLGGYAVLVGLLRQHLHDIMRIYGGNVPPPPWQAVYRSSNCPTASATRTTPHPPGHDSLRDPLSSASVAAANTSNPPEPAEARPPTLKPTILLLALIGDLASRQGNANEHRISKEEQYPRAIYRTLLRDVAGLADAADVDRLEDETDLALVGLFPLVVGGLDSIGGGGDVGWDLDDNGRGLLKRIITGDAEEGAGDGDGDGD